MDLPSKMLAGGSRSGDRENARADHRANAKRDQAPNPKRLLQSLARLLGRSDQRIDALGAKELAHC